ncbi:permease-like cell division protein FtsX [Ferviditalea candida]|uniref:Cell division protein FtsX n=1 Tax=Ferviditalea candida TaxID=3108399 RepID=A0ABU5ZIP0_9BACL|nr:permease-like cell division protein FtsX [Paenibacillaceae bacterium T2]
MRISTFARHLREGSKNIIRNGWMSFASTSAIAISLFILGVFVLLALNVNYLADQIEKQVEIRVYLDVNLPKDQIPVLQNQIGSIPEVSKVTFVSKEEGYRILKEKLGKENQDMLEGYDGANNPLPDSFTVEVDEPRNVAQAAGQIMALNNGKSPAPIGKVNYGQGTVETMFKVTALVRNVGLAMVVGLMITAMFLISNTIKLTIIARRKEIGIMKLVGATNGFIRWPFFIEGSLLGLIGSLVPLIVLLYGYSELVNASKVQLGMMMIQLLPVSRLSLKLAVLMLGIGVIIGIWGSVVSVRKFLKV